MNAPATAQDRLTAQRSLDATMLCQTTKSALQDLANIMNQETTLLRSGHYQEASELCAHKAHIAQEYVGLARVVQHQSERLHTQAPIELRALQAEHEKLATQMADNLRVLATAKTVSQNVLNDVAKSVAQSERPNTYGASGQINGKTAPQANGLSINRSL